MYLLWMQAIWHNTKEVLRYPGLYHVMRLQSDHHSTIVLYFTFVSCLLIQFLSNKTQFVFHNLISPFSACLGSGVMCADVFRRWGTEKNWYLTYGIQNRDSWLHGEIRCHVQGLKGDLCLYFLKLHGLFVMVSRLPVYTIYRVTEPGKEQYVWDLALRAAKLLH